MTHNSDHHEFGYHYLHPAEVLPAMLVSMTMLVLAMLVLVPMAMLASKLLLVMPYIMDMPDIIDMPDMLDMLVSQLLLDMLLNLSAMLLPLLLVSMRDIMILQSVMLTFTFALY